MESHLQKAQQATAGAGHCHAFLPVSNHELAACIWIFWAGCCECDTKLLNTGTCCSWMLTAKRCVLLVAFIVVGSNSTAVYALYYCE